MNNPGRKNLGDVSLAAINAATAAAVVTAETDRNGVNQAYIDSLDGMVGATLQANFNYGSGGTSLKVMIETTLDLGTTWIEVARFAFTTASAEKLFNLTNAAKLSGYTPAALSDDTAVDGLLGEYWRARILTVGTYAGNTSLSLRMQAR